MVLPADGCERLPASVAPGLATLGFMLPTTPLHLLVMQELETPAVMTSGNHSDEPQITDDDEMPSRLGSIAAHALMHNRRIANRVDDLVVQVMDGRARLLRRARGYAPVPIPLPPGFETAPDILALGGEVKAAFCLVKDSRAILSQHQGDLEHPAAFDDYRKNLALYRDLFDHVPMALVADLHPEYVSAKLAREMAQARGVPLIDVQHHHAHIAAASPKMGGRWPHRRCSASPSTGSAGAMTARSGAANSCSPIIAATSAWPALRRSRCRAAPAPSASRGAASTHTSRATSAGPNSRDSFGRSELCAALSAKPLATIDAMIARNLNSPPASSCGRLFDAVAAAIGICRRAPGL